MSWSPSMAAGASPKPIRVDLIFLKKTFKGQFLVVDQEWGLIGRDVLNHVSLLFDGPKLQWGE